ncbi:hypothetical protein JTE90_009273 [Oedothorax gibbosus]|uniref:Uncharacterized protein n=1 Tax=Oedothorax gibbosus TaxID=931172 RepID=A0AAV6V3I1_9ARAC|nr:hypothetical protein JTE90_009273 [Oedothorax gibbosus]
MSSITGYTLHVQLYFSFIFRLFRYLERNTRGLEDKFAGVRSFGSRLSQIATAKFNVIDATEVKGTD